MTTAWKTLVEQQSQLPLSDCPADRPCFTALPRLGVIQVSGHDASSFLQNLFTNDIRQLTVNQCQFSGLCNPKGRLLALFHVIRREQGYWLLLPHTLCDSLMARLQMYVLRSDVSLADITQGCHVLGVWHHDTSNGPALPPVIPYHAPRSLVMATADELDNVIQTLSEQAVLCSEQLWEQHDIDAGLPMIYPQSKELFTPQQVNLDLINGVSFQKGCYPGQEVVARLHYLGKPSRRMVVGNATLAAAPEVGDTVTDTNGEVAGHIVRFAAGEQQHYTLLVSLKLSALEADLFVDRTPLSLSRPFLQQILA